MPPQTPRRDGDFRMPAFFREIREGTLKHQVRAVAGFAPEPAIPVERAIMRREQRAVVACRQSAPVQIERGGFAGILRALAAAVLMHDHRAHPLRRGRNPQMIRRLDRQFARLCRRRVMHGEHFGGATVQDRAKNNEGGDNQRCGLRNHGASLARAGRTGHARVGQPHPAGGRAFSSNCVSTHQTKPSIRNAERLATRKAPARPWTR